LVLNLSEGLTAQIAVITMLAKNYPTDDEALKTVPRSLCCGDGFICRVLHPLIRRLVVGLAFGFQLLVAEDLSGGFFGINK
jgi:hypothetical protein